MTDIPEQRLNDDRRMADQGPPQGCDERRTHADRRLPMVEECAISDTELEQLFGHPHAQDKQD